MTQRSTTLKKFGLVVLGMTMITTLFAQAPTLLRDLNPGNKNGINEFNYLGVQLGDIYLLPANDGMTGEELYRIDRSGITLVSDLIPGATGSTPKQFIVSNAKVFFQAKGQDNVFRLWESDGTAAGTKLVGATAGFAVTDLFADRNGIIFFTSSGGQIRTYGPKTNVTTLLSNTSGVTFARDTETTGPRVCQYGDGIAFLSRITEKLQLWQANSQTATLLFEIDRPVSSTNIYGITPVGDNFLFAIEDFTRTINGLYVYNIRQDTIQRLVNFSTNDQLKPIRFQSLSSRQAAIMDVQSIYVTDGTPEGKVRISSTRPLLVQGQRWATAGFDDKMIFQSAQDVFSPTILTITNGTAAGTKESARVRNTSFEFSMLSYGEHVFWFSGGFNGFDIELWYTNLRTQTSVSAYKPPTGAPTLSFAVPLFVLDNQLYCTGNSNGSGIEIFTIPIRQTISTKETKVNTFYEVRLSQSGLYIGREDESSEQVRAYLYHLDGRLVANVNIHTDTMTPIPGLTSGIYFIQIESKSGVFSERLYYQSNN